MKGKFFTIPDSRKMLVTPYSRILSGQRNTKTLIYSRNLMHLKVLWLKFSAADRKP